LQFFKFFKKKLLYPYSCFDFQILVGTSAKEVFGNPKRVRREGEGRREKGEGRREKGEGRREKGEGRREEEGKRRVGKSAGGG
jgi:hypothetical protein